MISIVLGTRPEIIKLSPVIREFRKRKTEFSITHTGQHYSTNLDRIFFQELGLPKPDHNLHVGSASNNIQISRMLSSLDRILRAEQPAIVMVQGDTNSALAGALAASNLGIPVAHVEAGLRSFDLEMQEERNRVLISHCATLHFAPTETSRRNLLNEGIKDNVFVTGNTVVDACLQNLEVAEKKYSHDLGEFAIMTAHRAENVDRKERFGQILKGAGSIGTKVIYPVHPRARKMMKRFRLDAGDIKLVEPMGYLEFLYNMSRASFVVTDSGGVVEEAASLGVPSICVRDSTDRPEAVKAGFCVMAGADSGKIKEYGDRLLNDTAFRDSMKSGSNPYGDGMAAKRVADAICGFSSANY